MDQNVEVDRGPNPSDEMALFEHGQALRAAGDWGGAILALQAAGRLNPHRPETFLSLGVLHLQHGQPQTALELIQQTLALRPEYPEARNTLGHVQTALGQYAAAFAAFTAACELAPAHLPFLLHRAEAALKCGKGAWLRQNLEAQADANPLSAGPLLGLGTIHILEGRPNDAIDQLEAARVLDSAAAEPPLLLGMAYSVALQPDRAAPLLRLALDRDPNNANIANDLAATLSRLSLSEESAALLNDSIAKFGPSVIMLSNLATAEAALGKMDAALAAALGALRLAPEDRRPNRAYCTLLPYMDDVSAPQLLAALQKSARVLRKVPQLPCTVSSQPDRPLRIGLLSNVLRTHPVGWLTLAGLEALDRGNFSVHCFGRFDATNWQANRFARFAAAWHQSETMDDAAVAKLINDNQIDILIDLGGIGDAGCIDVCAHRPAPIQVKWVGTQFHSTGLDFIDYFITDRQETPPGFEQFYTEKLLRLPDGYVCYLPPAYAPDVGPLPAYENQHLTFGCLNNVMKITPATLSAWSIIMRASPGAHLLLRSPQFSEPGPRARFSDLLGQHGISPERLKLSGRAPHREFLATYNEIDIALDPFPYSGGLSTCEALYMGVPVLTRSGDIFAARHSVSHLANVGLHDWIADTTDDYIAKAKTLSADLPALAKIRASLRAQTTASPLCNAPLFGKNLGAALREIWVVYCEARP
jgi:protein O-GlcNAc transferase